MVSMFTQDNFESDKPAAARAVSILFGGALLILSAITSAAFFWRYAPGVFDFLSPAMSPYLAAATGVLCFEAASVCWSWLRAHDADTAVQLAVANVGAWGAMLAGLTVTAVYFTLNSDLIATRLDDAAIMFVSIAGGFLIVLGIGGNFALGFVYRNSAAGHMEASNAAELRAMQSAARHAARTETTRATLANTLQEIRRELPNQSKRQGAINAGQFIADNFTQDDADRGFRLIDLAERQPVNPTPNGRG